MQHPLSLFPPRPQPKYDEDVVHKFLDSIRYNLVKVDEKESFELFARRFTRFFRVDIRFEDGIQKRMSIILNDVLTQLNEYHITREDVQKIREIFQKKKADLDIKFLECNLNQAAIDSFFSHADDIVKKQNTFGDGPG